MSSQNFTTAKKEFDAERRTEPRYPVMLEAKVGLMSAANKTVRVSDLSVGGCYVNTILSADAGENIQLKLILPTHRSCAVSGVVAFHDPNMGFGIKFKLNEQQREFLEDLIEFARQDS